MSGAGKAAAFYSDGIDVDVIKKFQRYVLLEQFSKEKKETKSRKSTFPTQKETN